jgi:hypothetical protein
MSMERFKIFQVRGLIMSGFSRSGLNATRFHLYKHPNKSDRLSHRRNLGKKAAIIEFDTMQ